MDQRQILWKKIIENQLLEMKPTIGEYQSVVRKITWFESHFVGNPLKTGFVAGPIYVCHPCLIYFLADHSIYIRRILIPHTGYMLV